MMIKEKIHNTPPKILFFDIDGTLVSFNTHRVAPSTIEAVRKARQQGTKVWIATGRPQPFIGKLEGLEYDGVMSVNGGRCVANDGTVVFSKPVCRDDVVRMIEEQKRSGMAVVYAGNERAVLTAPTGVPDIVYEVFDYLDITLPALSPVEDALSIDVMQVIAFFTEAESEYVMGQILPQCNETRWHPAFADCVPKGTDKSTGIRAVADYYGVDVTETMAFGDGGNDITMLQTAGVGVAMGNANDDVKAAADIVTTTVDDDGIANVLNRFFK